MGTPGYGCQFCDGARPVNWLLTQISPANTVSTCDDDMAPAVIVLLAGMLGVEPGPFYESVQQYVEAAANDQRAEAEAQAAADKKAAQAAARRAKRQQAKAPVQTPAEVYAAQQEAIANGALDPDDGGGQDDEPGQHDGQLAEAGQ